MAAQLRVAGPKAAERGPAPQDRSEDGGDGEEQRGQEQHP